LEINENFEDLFFLLQT